MTGRVWTDQRRMLDAMRRGEWLRTRWIVRVAFEVSPSADYRPFVSRARRALRALVQDGRVERRSTAERRDGDVAGVPIVFRIPGDEWRLVNPIATPDGPDSPSRRK